MLHPSALPLACGPPMGRAPLGFRLMLRTPPGTPATHVRPRPGHEHGPGITPSILIEPPINVFTQCVRPRVANPSGLPLACSPRMERAPSGFCLSFAPHQDRWRRTSDRGQAIKHGPGTTLTTSAEPPISASTHCVRPRVASPSDLPQPVAARTEPAALGLEPRASHPDGQEPDGARRGGDRPSSTDLELPLNSHFRRSPIR